MTPTATLAAHIAQHGPIPSVRVSSAKARGNARRYPYWGAVRYELRLTRDGHVTHAPLERATSDRRSIRLVVDDANALAESEGRVFCPSLARGRVTDEQARDVLVQMKREGWLT